MCGQVRRLSLKQNNSDYKDNFQEDNNQDSIEKHAFEEQSVTLTSSPSGPKRMSRRSIIATTGIGVILAAGAAFGYVFAIDPMIQKSEATKELSEAFERKGPITAVNTEAILFVGEGDAPNSELSKSQKALSSNGIATSPAAFTFSNGKDLKDKKSLDIFLDFSSQRSRDFFVINQAIIRNMVESGQIDLNIHPVPTGSAFSVYAPQSLAETFVSYPEKSWSAFIELMKLSATLDEKGLTETDAVLKEIEKSNKNQGFSSITGETIISGTFASWILTVSDDPRLYNGSGLPSLYLNGGIIDDSVVEINNSTTLKNYIKNKG
jgi:hypothetical protein